MPGTVHFADTASSNLPLGVITADEVDKTLEKLKRRDNIEDFITGLVRVEVFPFPEGQTTAKPALMPFTKVTINPTKWSELTEIVYVAYTRSGDLVENTTQLLPDAGPGCYTEDRLVLSQDDPWNVVTVSQARSLRSALYSRYEWVASKVVDVNEMRRQHQEASEDPLGPDPETVDEEEHIDHEDLEEEIDPETMDVEVSTHDNLTSIFQLIEHQDDPVDEEEIEDEEVDIVFTADEQLQNEINKKIREVVAGKEVVIVNALGNNHGMEDGHTGSVVPTTYETEHADHRTDRTGRVKAAPTPPQDTKRSAEPNPAVHRCRPSQKGRRERVPNRYRALADIVGQITNILPSLAIGERECCFEALVKDFMLTARHMEAYNAIGGISVDFPDTDEEWSPCSTDNEEDCEDCEDSDEVYSCYEAHASQTYSSKATRRYLRDVLAI